MGIVSLPICLEHPLKHIQRDGKKKAVEIEVIDPSSEMRTIPTFKLPALLANPPRAEPTDDFGT